MSTTVTWTQIMELSKKNELDIWTLMRAIHTAQGGVLDFLTNELYKFPEHEIETFIPQLCNRVLKDPNAKSLTRFLMDRCATMHLAVKIFSWFQAAVEDGSFNRTRSTELWNECELAAINSKSKSAIHLNSFLKKNSSADDLSSLENTKTADRIENKLSSLGSGSQTLRPSRLRHKDDINFRSSKTNLREMLKEESYSRESSFDKSRDEDEERELANPVPGIAVENGAVKIDLEDPTSLPHPEPKLEEERYEEAKQEAEVPAPVILPAESKPISIPPRLGVLSFLPTKSASFGQTKIVSPNFESERFQIRQDSFRAEIQFISSLTAISTNLKKGGNKAKPELNYMLGKALDQLQNDFVGSVTESDLQSGALGVHIPIQRCDQPHKRIVRILPRECFCLSSRDRVPFMLFVETIEIDLTDPNAYTKPKSVQGTPKNNSHKDKSIVTALDKVISETSHKTIVGDASGPHPPPLDRPENPGDLTAEEFVLIEKDAKEGMSSARALAYPELWSDKVERIRKLSPFGDHPRWGVQSVIVKAGDDLRQEQLAVQLIQVIHSIFKEADLPLWLYSYNVVAVSSSTGFIETVPDAISLDSLKKRIPNIKSLEDYFVGVFGEKTSIKFMEAQRNFVESLAAYSLVCYLLQIKDRHNGNILLDKNGHIIHIDYGFMLTSSPGSLNFETAPFKLTQEFIDLMGGEHKDMFHYFKLLFIRGFLELRNHCDRFVLLIEGLLPGHKMGCFARREATVRELVERLHLELDENHVIEFVINHLIKESMSNWRTESYDNYQYYWNGILA